MIKIKKKSRKGQQKNYQQPKQGKNYILILLNFKMLQLKMLQTSCLLTLPYPDPSKTQKK